MLTLKPQGLVCDRDSQNIYFKAKYSNYSITIIIFKLKRQLKTCVSKLRVYFQNAISTVIKSETLVLLY